MQRDDRLVDDIDVRLPAVFSPNEVLSGPLSRHHMQQRMALSRWHRLRPGQYCLSSQWNSADRRTKHLLSAIAEARTHTDHVVSHLSAACLHGWLEPLHGFGDVTLTNPRLGQTGRRSAGSLVRVAHLPEAQMTWRHGVRVTTPARTAADLLRCAPASEAVALVDAALRRGDLSYAQLAEVLDWQERWPHVRRGRSLLTLIDPRRETWIESWSFAELHEVGVPLPEPQVDVFDAHGLWIARVDGLWVAEATVAEADGQIKYALDSPLNGYDGMPTQEQVRRVQRRLDE